MLEPEPEEVLLRHDSSSEAVLALSRLALLMSCEAAAQSLAGRATNEDNLIYRAALNELQVRAGRVERARSQFMH